MPAHPSPPWPSLPLDAWEETYATLHRWVQIVGKIRLALTPLSNHWWNTALLPSARGLTTGPMPFAGRTLELRFDFLDHLLAVETDGVARRTLPLVPRPVAEFHSALFSALSSMGIDVAINTRPQEIPNPVPFEQDLEHRSYDPAPVERWFRALLFAHHVLQEFRGRFRGKCSPVHFFWGSFDLAVSRFSGRPAPPRPGADLITREAYSDEVSSVGFWPGGGEVRQAAFYSYLAPAPQGFAQAQVRPEGAFFQPTLNEFLLLWDDVRAAPSPRAAVLDFCQSTYEAGADLAGWDREALERHGDEAGRPWPPAREPLLEPIGTGGPDAAGP